MRAQRMESIGFLTGGIAHDLNNVLAPILMAVPLLRQKLQDEEGQQTLNVLENSALRGAELVNHLLTFYRNQGEERCLLQPRHLLREMSYLVQQTFDKTLQIRNLTEHDVWPVYGNAVQLRQVLMNLCVNAQDAMPQGGLLTLAAQNMILDENYAGMTKDAKAGPYVVISVQDQGVGIPQEHLAKLFDPFFTTKAGNQGTGLGLSTSLGIIKSHGGFIEVHSQVGHGSVFRIFLPALPPAATGGTPAALDPNKLPKGNGQLILVVDDEASVRKIVRETLEKFGYRVQEAGDGVEAVTLFAQQRPNIHAVIMDLCMPIMDGKTTINTLRHIDPEVRILVIAGAGNFTKEGGMQDLGAKGFLSKPFSGEQLLVTLNEVLATSTSGHPQSAG